MDDAWNEHAKCPVNLGTTALPQEKIDVIIGFFKTTLNADTPTDALGTSRNDITENIYPFKSFASDVKRGVRKIIDQLGVDDMARVEANKVVHTAKSATVAMGQVGGVAQVHGAGGAVYEREHSEYMDLLGNDGSALEVAKLLGSSSRADVPDILSKASLTDLPHPLHVGDKLWNALRADNEATKRESTTRLPLTYINLWEMPCIPIGCLVTRLVARLPWKPRAIWEET